MIVAWYTFSLKVFERSQSFGRMAIMSFEGKIIKAIPKIVPHMPKLLLHT